MTHPDVNPPASRMLAGGIVEKGSAGRTNRPFSSSRIRFPQASICPLAVCKVMDEVRADLVTRFPIIAAHFGVDAMEVGDGD